MALPSLAKTWQYNRNNTVAAQGSATATNRRLMRSLKNALVGFGTNPWTLRYECDSVTAGTAGDGVTRWSADANLVGNSAGSAHSWTVLQQTGIGSSFQMCIDLTAATLQTATIVFSASAGFTGGTTTARPTATDEQVVVSGSSWGGGSADQQYRWSINQTTDGQCTRIITAAIGALVSVWVIDKLTSLVTGWTVPYCSLIYAGATPTLTNITTTGRARVGSVNATLQIVTEGTTAATGPADVTWGNIANEVDSSWPFYFAGVAGTTAGARGRLGNFQDLWLGSGSVATGDGYPVTGTNEFIQVGSLIFPWGGDSTALNLT